jgi:hypothetical protein
MLSEDDQAMSGFCSSRYLIHVQRLIQLVFVGFLHNMMQGHSFVIPLLDCISLFVFYVLLTDPVKSVFPIVCAGLLADCMHNTGLGLHTAVFLFFMLLVRLWIFSQKGYVPISTFILLAFFVVFLIKTALLVAINQPLGYSMLGSYAIQILFTMSCACYFYAFCSCSKRVL